MSSSAAHTSSAYALDVLMNSFVDFLVEEGEIEKPVALEVPLEVKLRLAAAYSPQVVSDDVSPLRGA